MKPCAAYAASSPRQTARCRSRRSGDTATACDRTEAGNEAYKKKKLGFPVPLREWIKTDKLYNIIKEKFNGESAKLFFDTKKINKLLEEHKNGKRDSYKKVWTIYTFLVWYDIYFNEI